ncbi:DUF5320 domain-containing protein [bacterium]|nr:DUF5320 domain-containing protein [candidate division CSSED10-310 bacterium]
MPGGDRMGPAGMGPMTGRAAGFCAGYSVPGYANPVGGRGGMAWGRGGGMGWGRGRGRGWGWGFRSVPAIPAPIAGTIPVPAPDEYRLDSLIQQAGYFKQALETIQKQIDDLQKADKKS